MNKIYVVESCNKCPHRGEYQDLESSSLAPIHLSVCKKDLAIIKNTFVIPQWCPLADLQEKK